MSTGTAAKPQRERHYLSQTDVPTYSLDKAIRVAAAIGDNYGFKPATPLQVAKALGMQPGSGTFRSLTGSSIAYGLTEGGYNADTISITPLGMRIVRPTAEGDDLAAKREALLRPRIIREFLHKYSQAPIPKENIAQNVLVEMGVPQEKVASVFELILEGANAVGFIQEIKDRKYVELQNNLSSNPTDEPEANDDPKPILVPAATRALDPVHATPPAPRVADSKSRKVFITHGKNKEFIEPIKKLLSFGELEAVVAAEKQTVSQPVPEKVMEDMRSCGAAIIHVADERHLMDQDAKEHVVLNENVLIEIGAAMALYGRRFILVVKDGVTLPSNLQGLYEVRYSGDTLDGSVTIKLMEAINDLKKRPLP